MRGKKRIILLIVTVAALLVGACAVAQKHYNTKLLHSINEDFTYRENADGKVVLTLETGTEVTIEFGNAAAKVVNAYQIDGTKERLSTVLFIRAYAESHGIEMPRSISDLYGEYQLHVDLYKLGYKRSCTGDADLDYQGDQRWYVNAVSKVLGWIEVEK